MNIYFGQVPQEYVDEMEDAFEHENKSFYYSLVMQDEELCLVDSVGRFVPIDRESVPRLMDALTIARHYYTKADQAQKLLDESDNAYMFLQELFDNQNPKERSV